MGYMTNDFTERHNRVISRYDPYALKSLR